MRDLGVNGCAYAAPGVRRSGKFQPGSAGIPGGGGVARGSSRRVFATMAALALTIQGCAGTGTSTSQSVRVETPGCAQASCELSNDRGAWQVPSTPGTVVLITSNSVLKVSCRTQGGDVGSVGTPSILPAVTGAGAVAGGAAGGVALGAAVGATALSFIPVLGALALVTGAAVGAVAGHTLETYQRAIAYPESIRVPMACAENGASDSQTVPLQTAPGRDEHAVPTSPSPKPDQS